MSQQEGRLLRRWSATAGLLLLAAGCTNVVDDQPRRITATAMARDAVMSTAAALFSSQGYLCEQHREDLYCRKVLRDHAFHQTRADVKVIEDTAGGPFLLVSSRWDEGLIPGEFLSNSFVNDDVIVLCRHLRETETGQCSLYEGD